MNRYPISQAIVDVAAGLHPSDANDLPMIRTALNDTLDAAGKAGLLVRYDYDQARAVARVRALLTTPARSPAGL